MAAREGTALVAVLIGFLALCAASPAAEKELASGAAGWYAFYEGDMPVGCLELGLSRTENEDAPVALEVAMRFGMRDPEISWTARIECRDDELLTPVRIESVGKGGMDEFGTFEAEIDWGEDGEGGRLHAELESPVEGRPDRSVDLELPPRTTTLMAVLELVTRRPREVGEVLEFNVFEASELGPAGEASLAYVGLSQVEVGGQRLDLHEFTQTFGGRRPAHYWVDDDGLLRRVLLDERKEIVRVSKEEAERVLQAAKDAARQRSGSLN